MESALRESGYYQFMGKSMLAPASARRKGHASSFSFLCLDDLQSG